MRARGVVSEAARQEAERERMWAVATWCMAVGAGILVVHLVVWPELGGAAVRWQLLVGMVAAVFWGLGLGVLWGARA